MGKVSDGVAAGMADSLLKDIGWLMNDNMTMMSMWIWTNLHMADLLDPDQHGACGSRR